MILKRMEVGQLSVFCYLIACETTRCAAVVDPGSDAQRILRAARTLDLEIKEILLTHCHPDHIGGLSEIKSATGATIRIHEDEAMILPRIHQLMPFFPGLKPAPPADIHLKDGDVVEIGLEKVTVIHTPGHSPGGVCFRAGDSVLTGDTLFVGGIGRTDVPGGDHGRLLASIRGKLFALGDDVKVLPGHNYGARPSSTIGEERKTNPSVR